MFEWLRKQKERNRLRYFTYAIYGILLFIVFAIILVIVGGSILNTVHGQKTFWFNKRPTIVITGSMEPAIQVNSIVVLEPVNFNDLEEGDIIRYDSNNGYSVMHRVVKKTVSYVVTKGDNNEVADTLPVFPQQVTGRVVSIHNEYASIITTIFGKFSYDDMGGSALRACAGMIGIGLFIAVMVTMFIVIFEMITITFFFNKYGENLVNSSSYWLDNISTKSEEKEIVAEYIRSYSSSNIFKKIVLAFMFRRWYNGLCNIEKEVNKTSKRLRILNILTGKKNE